MSYADPDAGSVVERATIRMPYLHDDVVKRLERLVRAYPVVAPGSPVRARRVAERLGRQFHRESRFDMPPYLADWPDGQWVVLMPSRDRVVGGGQLFAGALGIDPAAKYSELPGPVPIVLWIYLHPYERGSGLVERIWPAITRRWPRIRLPGPFTKAGRALASRLIEKGVQPRELVHGL